MQAVILAGGFGVRLESVLKEMNIPKPMVPIKGKPFLEYVLLLLKDNGINDFVFCLYHMADKIADYFGDGSKWEVNIKYAYEKQPLQSAGALKNAEEFLEEDFFVINGDNYFDISHKELMDYHKEKNAFITLGATSPERAETHGVCTTLNVDEEGKVINEFGKEITSKSNAIHTGTFVIKKDIIKMLPENTPVSLEKDLTPKYIEEGKVFSKSSNGYYIDIGTPEMYEKFINDVKAGRINI